MNRVLPSSRLSARVSLASALAAAALIAPTPALAQVAPPPGEKTTSEPYEPPQRTQPTRTVPEQPKRAPNEPVELPDIEHGSLVERDANGKIIRLDQNSSVAALELNPMIDDELRPLVDEYLVERKKEAMERAIQYNDFCRRIYNEKLLDTMTTQDAESLEEILGLLQPLVMRGAAETLAVEYEVLDEVAVQFNRKIANGYLSAVHNEVTAEGPAEGETMPDLITRVMFRDATRDVMSAYERIMAQTALLLAYDRGTDAITLTNEERDTLRPLIDKIMMAGRTEQYTTITGKIFDELNEEQRLTLLEQTRQWFIVRGEDF